MLTLKTAYKQVEGNEVVYDENVSPTNHPGLWETCPLAPIAHDPTLAHVYEENFATYTSGEGGWETTATNSGSVSVITAAAGYLGSALRVSPSDATAADNDETYVERENLNYILASGKDIWFEATIKQTETNVDDANYAIGIASKCLANTILDDGGGATTGSSVICIQKKDGGTTYEGWANTATTAATAITLATRRSGVWQRVGFHVKSNDTVDFYVNGVLCGTKTANIPTAAMGIYFGAKNGGANHDQFYVRNIKVVQLL